MTPLDSSMNRENKVQIYDTTLRDGTQGEDVALSVHDKLKILSMLDDFGIPYIEGGWPGSNPRDITFFKEAAKIELKQARLVAFGSTHRANVRASKDDNLKAIIASRTPTATIFGKSWDLHVEHALRVSQKKNLSMIQDSVAFLSDKNLEVFFDAEHFFDGYKNNPDYALQTLVAAQAGGCRTVILCDTNGGTMVHEIENIILEVSKHLKVPFGIHAHDDCGLGVANSLAAVRLGAAQVQGTLNGIGERCGNANLVSVIANLQIKMGFRVLPKTSVENLTSFASGIAEVANIPLSRRAPFVGQSAFAHKGGVHTSALMRNRASYEHIAPEEVGNRQRLLFSDLAGKSHLAKKAKEWGIVFRKDKDLERCLKGLKDLENEGYQFEAAEGSLELFLRKSLKLFTRTFDLKGFSVIDRVTATDLQQRFGTEISEAIIRLEVEASEEHTAASGLGPVHALNRALKKALVRFYPELEAVHLIDYKVRVLPSDSGTASGVRVLIESTDGAARWGTVGVSDNILVASWHALVDSLEYKLLLDGKNHA